MAFKKAVIAGLALGWAVSLFAAQEDRKPLVRKDLLVFGSGEIAAPVRDIFRPKTAAPPVVRRAGEPAVKSAAVFRPDAPPSFTLNFSYIGSVKSGGQTIALVLRNGQAVSVGEGDEIAPGYKVVKVTAEAIVIQGPNSERKTFPRQGDRP
ncbi:MAG: hypothetical protein IMZ54_04220 [Acidobacteria bacterium]|nr:hypothetical protein [Acidobacteriota bacterium]